jgi:hypothetical protein
MGLIMQIVGMIAQNSVGPGDMGVASSTSMFFRSIGGAFGVSIFGAILTTTMTDGLSGFLARPQTLLILSVVALIMLAPVISRVYGRLRRPGSTGDDAGSAAGADARGPELKR